MLTKKSTNYLKYLDPKLTYRGFKYLFGSLQFYELKFIYTQILQCYRLYF